MLPSRKQTTANTGKDAEERNPYTLLVGMPVNPAAMENGIYPKNQRKYTVEIPVYLYLLWHYSR
jgi:hypothetical protein